jgi:multiple sugar transport system ATP-binding protein
MAAILLEQLTKRYDGGTLAVDRLDLAIGDGEFLVLVGPSGCGKTTVLRLIAGLETPTTGSVCIGGRPMEGRKPRDRDVAMVFQNYALYPHLTARQNMAFPLRLRGYPRAEIDRRVLDAAAMLGIDDLLERRPGEMSGGQRQRVALGRAIVRQPVCFLFDEPLASLDPALRRETRTELKRLHSELGVTTLYVTHDPEEAMTLGHRVAVLDRGQLLQVGTPEEVFGAAGRR